VEIVTTMQEGTPYPVDSSRSEKFMARSAEKNRLLIVDDHPLFREGLRQMIDRTAGLMVCGEAADAAAALKGIPELKPDLVLVDISLGGANGIDLIKSIKGKYDDLPVLVISMHDESLYAERALRAGALGYVMKNAPAKTVKSAIFKVLGGEMFLSGKMTSSVLARLMRGKPDKPVSPIEQLSDRELEVFQMLGQGKGTRQIAEELGLTIPTINSFRNRIKEKLELKNSTEMMLHAIQWSRDRVGK
jgi:DNA-binding NarL/FixJ family response regulator